MAERLRQAEGAAVALAEAVRAPTTVFRAYATGTEVAGLNAAMERAIRRHNEVCARLDDKPLIGAEVRAMRESLQSQGLLDDRN